MRPSGGRAFGKAHAWTRGAAYALSVLITAFGVTDVDAASAPRALQRRDLGIEQHGSSTQSVLRDMLQSDATDSPVGVYLPSMRQQLLSFYGARAFKPAWTGGPAELSKAVEALAVLAHAEDHGLRREDYASPAVQWSKHPKPGREAAEYDVSLTEALLRYSRDVAIGRMRPIDVYADVQLPAPKFDAVAILTKMLSYRSISASLADLPPPHPEYRQLVEVLAHYRSIAAQGGWSSLSTGADLAALAERLALEDPMLTSTPKPSGEELREAVKRFQTRNGLEADGRVAATTLAALNVPVSRRIEQIVANMERWRWLPREFEGRYIAINVPDQSVEFVREGVTALISRVVVGRKQSPTPILYTTVIAAIVNPPWPIPGDIVVNQILPKLRRNSSYLASKNMVLLNGPENDPQGRKINWQKVPAEDFPYRVVQVPGPTNGLGRLMLDSPNDYDVYLHDTPGKALFKSPARAVSNGCVRVEAILPLTTLALGEGDAAERIAEGIGAGDTRRLELETPLPVYFLYWTAITTSDGTVGFRRDLYGRDERMTAALNAPPEEISAPESDADEVGSGAGSGRIVDILEPAETEQPIAAELLADADPFAEVDTRDEAASAAGEAVATGESDSNSPIEPTRLTSGPHSSETMRPTEGRWSTESTQFYRNRRPVESEGLFPLIKRLLKNKRSQRYSR